MSDEEVSCHELYRQQRQQKQQRQQNKRQKRGLDTATAVLVEKCTTIPVSVAARDEFGRLSFLKQTLFAPVSLGVHPVSEVLSNVEGVDLGSESRVDVPPLSAIMLPAPTVSDTDALDVLLESLSQPEAVVPPPPPPHNRMGVFLKKYQPSALEKMFGQDRAMRALVQWYSTGQWKKQPFVLWGPCGVGKTLMSNLLAQKHGARFVQYEDEWDAPDKLKGWIQSASGVLAFSDTASQPLPDTWMLLDDLDSLEAQCRSTLITCFKKCLNKQFPGPLILTCSNVHDKHMAPLKALPHTAQLTVHTQSNLQRLARTVDPTLSPPVVEQLAALACGDARRLLNEARLASIVQNHKDILATKAEPHVYHSPFVAAQALVRTPEVKSRALDGQEFLVQQLLYQNYPVCCSSLDALADTAAAFSEFDVLDRVHELPEYTKTYLTYVVPKRVGLKQRSMVPTFRLNPKQMHQTVPCKKVALDWHCMQKC